MNIELTLPFPPSVNSYYRCLGSRVVLSERGRKYKAEVRKICILAGWHNIGIAEPCEVHIVLRHNAPLRFDADNRIKALLDALEGGGVLDNDKWVWVVSAAKEQTPIGKSAVVRIFWGTKGQDYE